MEISVLFLCARFGDPSPYMSTRIYQTLSAMMMEASLFSLRLCQSGLVKESVNSVSAGRFQLDRLTFPEYHLARSYTCNSSLIGDLPLLLRTGYQYGNE
jgi:hypothetical protein